MQKLIWLPLNLHKNNFLFLKTGISLFKKNQRGDNTTTIFISRLKKLSLQLSMKKNKKKPNLHLRIPKSQEQVTTGIFGAEIENRRIDYKFIYKAVSAKPTLWSQVTVLPFPWRRHLNHYLESIKQRVPGLRRSEWAQLKKGCTVQYSGINQTFTCGMLRPSSLLCTFPLPPQEGDRKIPLSRLTRCVRHCHEALGTDQ